MGFIAFIVCVALDVYIAALARERGRSFAGFLALGLFLSPVVSGIVLLAAGKKETEADGRELHRHAGEQGVTAGEKEA